MASTITSAIAVTFAWTTAGTDISLAFPSGTSPVNVSVPTGSYRMGLAPTTGTVTDFLRAAQQAINDEMATQGRAETFTLTLNADGRVVLTIDTGTFSAALGTMLRTLGWSTQPMAVSTSTALYGPKYLMLFVSRQSSGWTARTPIAAAETAGGVSYGVSSGIVRAEDTFTFGFIPRDPAAATLTAQNGTPWEPAPADLGSLGSHNVPWGCVDNLAVALGQSCALARGNWQTLRTSTTERYDLCAITGTDLAAPRAGYQFAPWEAYVQWQVSLIRQSATPTGTRA